MKPAVLFDLGNTLAAYYRSEEFGPILEAAIVGVLDELRSRGLAAVPFEAAISAATAENREAADFRFSPMADRFTRIFGVDVGADPVLAQALCTRFLSPIFAMGRVYDDAFPVLQEFRRLGYPTAIVSNAPWGSPPGLWRQELKRLGLADAVDSVALCGDVGWRKPAPQIFHYAAGTLDRAASDCIFVGDDLRWDIEGSAAVGMHPVLVDRDDRERHYAGARVSDLNGMLALVVDGALQRGRPDARAMETRE
jgi:putative hydrolase of the HAD superfamily